MGTMKGCKCVFVVCMINMHPLSHSKIHIPYPRVHHLAAIPQIFEEDPTGGVT